MTSRRSRRIRGLEPESESDDSISSSSEPEPDDEDDDDDAEPDVGDTFVAFVSNATSGKTYAVRIRPKQNVNGINNSDTYPINHAKVGDAFATDVHTAAEQVRQSWWIYSPAVRRQMLNANRRLNVYNGTAEYKMPTVDTLPNAVEQWRELHPLQRTRTDEDLVCESAESAACTCAQWKFRIVDSFVAGPIVDYSLDPTPAAKKTQKNSNRVDDRCESIRQARNVAVNPYAGFVNRTHEIRRSCHVPMLQKCKHMLRVDAYLSNPVRAATPLDAPLQINMP